MDIKQTIWSSADGVPSRTVDMSYPSASLASRTFSSSTSSNSGGADPFEPSVRHRGHSWDFSVTLPSEVSVTYGRSKQMGTFSLPETFTERLGRASIAYEISVLYSKGKWQTDYRCVCGHALNLYVVSIYENSVYLCFLDIFPSRGLHPFRLLGNFRTRRMLRYWDLPWIWRGGSA